MSRIFRIVNGQEVELPSRRAGREYICTTTGSRELSDAEVAAQEADRQAIAAEIADRIANRPPSLSERMVEMEDQMAALIARVEALEG